MAVDCLRSWDMNEIRKHSPDLMRETFKFLTSPRTVEQLQRFQAAVIPCRCELSQDSTGFVSILHEGEVEKHDQDGHGPLGTAWRLFSFGVKIFETVSVRKVFSNATQRCCPEHPQKKKQEEWPSHASDLLPFGPQRFVVATRAWMSFFRAEDYQGLTLFWRAVEFSPSLFTELLLHPQLVQDIYSEYMAFPDRSQALLRDGMSSRRVCSMVAGLTLSLIAILDFPPTSRTMLLPTTTRLELERAARRLLSILPELSGHTSDLGQEAYTKTRDLQKVLSGSIEEEAMVQYGHYKASCNLNDDPFHSLDIAWRHFLIRSQCSGPDCLRTIESDSQHCGFGVCAGCGVLKFCSKLCQERCWKEKEHRSFCRELGRFKELRRSLASVACCKNCVYMQRSVVEGALENLKDWADQDLVDMLAHLSGLRCSSDEALVASVVRVSEDFRRLC